MLGALSRTTSRRFNIKRVPKRVPPWTAKRDRSKRCACRPRRVLVQGPLLLLHRSRQAPATRLQDAASSRNWKTAFVQIVVGSRHAPKGLLLEVHRAARANQLRAVLIPVGVALISIGALAWYGVYWIPAKPGLGAFQNFPAYVKLLAPDLEIIDSAEVDLGLKFGDPPRVKVVLPVLASGIRRDRPSRRQWTRDRAAIHDRCLAHESRHDPRTRNDRTEAGLRGWHRKREVWWRRLPVLSPAGAALTASRDA